MKTITLVLFCISLVFLTASSASPQLARPAGAQVKSQPKPPQQQAQAKSLEYNRLFQCDEPDRSLRREAGLVLERPEDPQFYRLPRIVITGADGTKSVFRVQGSSWLYFPNPLAESNTVKTTFWALNTVLGAEPSAIEFELQSNGSFQPLSGVLFPGDPNRKITFRTCGRQTTSAYYWTRSSQNKFEAFSCPALGKPKGCPAVGRN